MKSTLRNFLTKNTGYKVLAIIFALILWMVVVNVEDPQRSAAYTIPVRIENPTYLEDLGYSYEILNNTDEITVSISAERSVIEELSDNDFVATADLSAISADMTRVPVEVICMRHANRVEISKQTSYMMVRVEKLGSETFPIEVETEGTPAGLNVLAETTVDPTSVTVSGPQSVVESIVSAQVTVDASGATADFSQTAKIRLFDSDKKEILDARLSQNVEQATVNVTVLNGKEVPLNLITSGTPAKGYTCTSVKPSETDIVLMGTAAELSKITKLDIEAEELNLEGLAESFDAVIELGPYLPEGLSLGKNEPEAITVSVTIVGEEGTREIELPAENIRIENLADGYNCQINDKKVTVTLKGNIADLEKIDPSELSPTIDVANLDVGKHKVSLVMPEGYALDEETLIRITISTDTAQEETTPQQEEQTEEGASPGASADEKKQTEEALTDTQEE